MNSPDVQAALEQLTPEQRQDHERAHGYFAAFLDARAREPDGICGSFAQEYADEAAIRRRHVDGPVWEARAEESRRLADQVAELEVS